MKLHTSVEEAAATDKHRPTLRAVLFDSERALACDGFILASVPIEDNEDNESRIVDRDMVKLAKRGGVTEIDLSDDERVKFAYKTGEMSAPYVEGKHPDCSTVLQVASDLQIGAEGTITIALNVNLLLRLAKAIGAAEKHSGITITIGNPNEGMAVRPIGGAEPDAFGVIMPIHLADETHR